MREMGEGGGGADTEKLTQTSQIYAVAKETQKNEHNTTEVVR